ncbi:MAG: hypothetical protein C0598_06935 [Marinilabiliales bacterium]|nr:MAG: hypothetical protein C0598_06935 [Marinilabiliales bacterium]
MPRTEEQYKDIREQKKALIKETAMELFAQKGFSGTSMSLIAKQAGISKGLIYNYFTNKEDLIKTIIIDGFKIIIDVFDTNKDGVLTDEEMVFFLKGTSSILKENTSFWKLYLIVMMQADVMKLIENEFMEFLAPLLKTLVQYFEQKGVKDPVAHANLLGALLDGITLNYVIDPEHFPIDSIIDLIIDKFLK